MENNTSIKQMESELYATLDKKISDMLTPYAVDILVENGIDPNKKISGIIIGTVKD